MQTHIWEKEYQNRRLVTCDAKPQKFFLKFLKFLKKEGVSIDKLKILDLGSGTGRNANYLVERGAKVLGMEIAKNALDLARKRSLELGLKLDYLHQSIGEIYPFPDKSFDLVLDITSSNSLNEDERKVYLSEVGRVLRPKGYFFVRALCLDGDRNARNLLRDCPGPEESTYIMPKIGLVERVFSRQNFLETYKNFRLIKLERQIAYTSFGNQSYKRNFWLGVFGSYTI